MVTHTVIKAVIIPTTTNGSTEYYVSSISGAFTSDIIICTTDICNIQCDTYNGCAGTSINASISTTLLLDCADVQSCFMTSIVIGPTKSVNINCVAKTSCKDANFNIKDTPNVNINCHYDRTCWCSSEDASCYSTTFNAEYSKSVNIYCAGNYDCNQATFNLNNSATATISCSYQGCWYSNFIGTSISKSLTINCTDSYSCSNANVYCSGNINALCNIVTHSSYSFLNSNIYLPSINTSYVNLECGLYECSEIDLVCQDTGLITNYIYSDINNEYVCLTDDCCPPLLYQTNITILNCSELFGVMTDCNIDCNAFGGCFFKTIVDGSQSNSLTITCDTLNECQYLNIICPSNGRCGINCTKWNSCEYIKFEQQTISDLQILCGPASYTCQNMIIDLIVTNNVNISCFGDLSCNHGQINLEADGDSVDIFCSKRQSCQEAIIRIKGTENVTDVTITGMNGNALYYAKIYILQVNSLSINCFSGSTTCIGLNLTAIGLRSANIVCQDTEVCIESSWNLDAGNITIVCDGNSSCVANNIITNIGNSLVVTTTNPNAFHNTSIDVHCDDCINTYNCLENLTISCGLNSEPYLIADKDQCRTCECDGNTDQYILYDNPTNIWQTCVPTSSPTSEPTNIPSSIPAHSPTANTQNPTKHPTDFPSTGSPTSNSTVSPSTKLPTKYPTILPTEHQIEVLTSEPQFRTESSVVYISSNEDNAMDSSFIESNLFVFLFVAIGIMMFLSVCIVISIYIRKRRKDIGGKEIRMSHNTSIMMTKNNKSQTQNTRVQRIKSASDIDNLSGSNNLLMDNVVDDVNSNTYTVGGVKMDDGEPTIQTKQTEGISAEEFVIEGDDEIQTTMK